MQPTCALLLPRMRLSDELHDVRLTCLDPSQACRHVLVALLRRALLQCPRCDEASTARSRANELLGNVRTCAPITIHLASSQPPSRLSLVGLASPLRLATRSGIPLASPRRWTRATSTSCVLPSSSTAALPCWRTWAGHGWQLDRTLTACFRCPRVSRSPMLRPRRTQSPLLHWCVHA